MPIEKTADEIVEMVKANATAIAASKPGTVERTAALEELKAQVVELQLGAQPSIQNTADHIKAHTRGDPESDRVAKRAPAGHMCGSVLLHGYIVKDGSTEIFYPGLLDGTPMNQEHGDLQKAMTQRAVVRTALSQGGRLQVSTPRSDELCRTAAIRAGFEPEQVTKMFSDVAGAGAEWLRTSQLHVAETAMEASSGGFGLLTEKPHPGGTLTIPVRTGHVQAFNTAIPTTDDPANDPLTQYATDDDSVKLLGLTAGLQFHNDAAEDSMIAVLPDAFVELGKAMGFARAMALFNGNVAGDTVAAWNGRGRMSYTLDTSLNLFNRWDGLRSISIADGTSIDLSAAQTYAGFRSAFNLLDISARIGMMTKEDQLVCSVSPEFFFAVMQHWDEFQSQNDMGPLATLITGALGNTGTLAFQVGMLFGHIPVILEFSMTPDMSASGVYDGITTNKTGAIFWRPSAFELWQGPKGLHTVSGVNIRNNTTSVIARNRDNIRRKTGTKYASYAYGLNT